MIKRRGYETYEEAETEAKALIRKYGSGGKINTMQNFERGGRVLCAYIEEKKTGATGYIYLIGEDYGLTFLTGEEISEDNRTYPYRGLPKDHALYLIAMQTPIFKPVREIKPEEALTPEGLKDIYFFFGKETKTFLTEEEAADYTIVTAFDDNNKLICLPFPQALTNLTGIKVNTLSDYAKGISILLKAELSKKQEASAKGALLFEASCAFLRYATYEFFRTENYNHLKDILTAYKEFCLYENWENDCPLHKIYANLTRGDRFTPEGYVLGVYLSKYQANVVGRQARLKDIAEFTCTPFSLLNRVYRLNQLIFCDNK